MRSFPSSAGVLTLLLFSLTSWLIINIRWSEAQLPDSYNMFLQYYYKIFSCYMKYKLTMFSVSVCTNLVCSSAAATLTWRNAATRVGLWCSWTSNSSSWSWRSWRTFDPSPIKSLLRLTSRRTTWRRMTWSSLSRITGWDEDARKWTFYFIVRFVSVCISCFTDWLAVSVCRSTPWSS